MEKLEKTENFEERGHQKLYVTEASGKKSTSRASLRELKNLKRCEIDPYHYKRFRSGLDKYVKVYFSVLIFCKTSCLK